MKCCQNCVILTPCLNSLRNRLLIFKPSPTKGVGRTTPTLPTSHAPPRLSQLLGKPCSTINLWSFHIHQQKPQERRHKSIMVLGKLTRFLQNFKFKIASFLRKPTDGLIFRSSMHSSSSIFSRFWASLTSGISTKFSEKERSKRFKLCSGYSDWQVEEKINKDIWVFFN